MTHLRSGKMKKQEFEVCVLCDALIEKDKGKNPEPIKSYGVCCERCNIEKVIPVRLVNIMKEVHRK
jgi:hypothetical protein